MAKITLNNITNPEDISLINNNFNKIVDEFENKVLYRSNVVGDSNEMHNDLDMNSHDILNVDQLHAKRIITEVLVGTTLENKHIESGEYKSGTLTLTYNTGESIKIDGFPTSRTPFAPTLSLHFAGIYNTLDDLKDAVASPTGNMQAIVISPSEKYYHGVGGAWVELAPVGSFHPNYLGAYDSVADLKLANPNPPKDALAIVGTTDKVFFLFSSNKWEQLQHTDLPSLDARVKGVEDGLVKTNSDLQASIQVLQSNIDQKPDGLTVSDEKGTTFNDLRALGFKGGELEDNGDGTYSLRIAPKITVADGQDTSSTSVVGNAIVFDNATVRQDPSDSDVILVDIPDNGIVLGDGVNASRQVKRVILKGHTATGQGDEANIHIEFLHFKTLKEKDDWTAKFGPVMDFDTVAVVDADENGFVQWYVFRSSTKTWEEYNAQGVVLSDSSGAIPKNIKTVVFGPGFSVQQAGSEEDAALITYSGSSGIDGIEFKQISDGSTVKASKVNIYPPLEVSADGADTAKLVIRPDAYERMHKPSFLAYLAETEEVVGKAPLTDKSHNDGALWFDDVVWPSGEYIVLDKDNKAYGIQEADQLDPNVTGGTNYLVVFRVAMKGEAPDDGFVRAYLYDKAVGPFDETGYLKDVNGQIMGVQKSYKSGDELGYLEVIGVVNAKAIREFTCHVLDNFASDNINLEDRTEGGTCLMIQALTSESKTGMGLQQFELDTQQNLQFSSHYLGVKRASIDWFVQSDKPVEVGDAGQGMTLTDGLHFYNLSKMKTSVQGGQLIFQDDGSTVCDFNFGKIFSAEETQMMRGKDIDVTVTLVDKNSAWNLSLVKWTGKPDEYTKKIYTGRDGGGAIELEPNWEVESTAFIPEDVVSGDHVFKNVFTVPSDANNYAVVIFPISSQQPLTLKLKQFDVDVSTPFVGFAITDPELVSEKHLELSEGYRELIQGTQGFASLRYTINNSRTPMPVGVIGKGAAAITLDPAANPVVGSQARGGEGAIEFNADGEAKISSTYSVYAGENVPKGEKRNVRFWWANVGVDGQFTEIPDSSVEVEVTGGDVIPMTVTIPAFSIQVEAGNKIAAFAQADIADGAFIEAVGHKNAVVNTIDFKELLAVGGDDPWAGVDFSSFDNTYFSVVKASKVVSNAKTSTFTLDLPEGATFDISSVLENADGSLQSIGRNNDYTFSWDAINKEVTVDFTRVGNYRIIFDIMQ